MPISQNIARIQEQIVAAAKRSGRSETDVSLMAVSKTFPTSSIHEAYKSGIRVFGENKVQEFSVKAPDVSNLTDAAYHMIGHLQTNKSAKAVELFTAIDSVDSLKLAERLNASASQFKKKLPILIEINIGGETAKNGVAPDSPELELLLQAGARLEHLEIRGLMTVPPFAEDPEHVRQHFRQLRELRDRIAARHISAINVDTLSMGMSHDFGVAIEEGSTCVRIGTAIFGERNYTSPG